MYERTRLLIGDEGISKLKKSSVAIFGVGGVGSFICEGLARAGIGNLTIIDFDIIAESNINRQLHALNSTVGKYKVDVLAERILDINPTAIVTALKLFYPAEDKNGLRWDYDYVADAVDNVTAKIRIIETAKKLDVNIISCMGTGNKLDPTKFAIADIYDTAVCPLAKVMRKELRKRNIKSLKTLYSYEEPLRKEKPPASISFVPSVAGLIIAGEIIKDLCGLHLNNS